MATDATPLDHARQRLQRTIADIVALVAEDVAGYPVSELRRRFVEFPQGDALDDGQLKALRQEARELGRASADEVKARLTPLDLWLKSDDDGKCVGHLRSLPSEEDCKDLSALRPVWAVVQGIDARLEAIAGKYGLPPDDRVPKGYTPPKRFISGKHLPTLVEHFWRELAEVRRLEAGERATAGEQKRRTRAERWGQAD
jgi:hypothetical protein